MKLTELKHKEIGELQKELKDTSKDLVRASMEVSLRRDKNTRKAFELKRKVATLKALLSAKTANSPVSKEEVSINATKTSSQKDKQ